MNAQQRRELAAYFVSLDTTPVNIIARAYRTTNQSITTGVATAITFDTQRYDTDEMWDAGAPTRLTCTREGMYFIWGGARWASNATGVRALQIRYNGLTFIGSTAGPPTNGDVTDTQVTAHIYLLVGDYVELMAYQTSGGALNVTTNSAFSPEFSMQRLA